MQYVSLHSLTPFYNTWLSVLPQYTPVYSSIPQYIVVDVAYRYQELQLPSEDSTLELTEKGDSTLELTEVDDATPELTEDRVISGNYSQLYIWLVAMAFVWYVFP